MVKELVRAKEKKKGLDVPESLRWEGGRAEKPLPRKKAYCLGGVNEVPQPPRWDVSKFASAGPAGTNPTRNPQGGRQEGHIGQATDT